MAQVPATRKGTAKLNELLDIEQKVQERWEQEKIFEIDAPEPGSEEAKWVNVIFGMYQNILSVSNPWSLNIC